MSQSECISCRKSKAPYTCEVCNESLCKSCLQRLDADTFSFLAEIPEPLSHTNYCGPCYDEVVAPELDAYEEIKERAKNVYVYFKTQRKEIPLQRKSKEVFKVRDRADRDDTIFRLGFFAAQAGYNAIVEVDVYAEKVRNEAYQNSKWHGSGIAAQIDAEKQDRQDMVDKVYR